VALKEVIEIFRPLNALMGAVGVISGVVIAGGTSALTANIFYVLLGALAAVFYTGGGNSLNDYFDLEVDRKNHPDRPLPSGRMKPRSALIIGVFGFALSLILSLPLGLYPFIIMSLAVGLLTSYELFLKMRGLPGNIAIAIIVSLAFPYGGAITGITPALWVFFTMSALSNLGREIIKDVEDVEGDFNRSTLPKKIGVRGASQLSASLTIAAVLISPIPALLGYFTGAGLYAYTALVAAADLMFILSVKEIIRVGEGVSKKMKLAMLLGLVAFILGAALS